LAAALVEGGLKEAPKIAPNKGEGPVRVEGEVAEDADLGATAKVVNDANTPHKGQSAPGLSLVLFAELDEDSAEKALKAVGEVKGIDAEGSAADVKKGEISVKISGEEKVTIADLLEALKDADIEATTSKEKA
jgi:hypothetical protein